MVGNRGLKKIETSLADYTFTKASTDYNEMSKTWLDTTITIGDIGLKNGM